MRTFIFLLSVLTFTGMMSELNGQNNNSTGRAADTLVHLGGGKNPVRIVNVTNSKIYFTEVGESDVNELDREQVERIIHSTGRVEVLNRPVFEMITEDNWRHVLVTEDPEDVQFLDELGHLEITAPARRNRKTTIRNAEIRLMRQTAALGGTMLLVTGTQFSGGYGDVPTVTMKGVAFGFMPH